MRFGVRRPSNKKSIAARTTGKAKRKIKKLANPFYGKKGMGWIKNPKRAFKNKIYKKTTISAKGAVGCLGACIYYPFYWTIMLCWWMLIISLWVMKYTIIGMWWLCVLIINAIISIIGKVSGREVVEPTTTTESPETLSE